MLSASRIISARGARPAPEDVARLGRWLVLPLVVVLAWSLAQLTWTLLTPQEIGPLPVARDLPSAPPSVAPLSNEVPRLTAVADLQLFGHAETVIEAPAVPTEAPETRLRLTLKGVVASPEPALGVALIADDRQNERHYRVGAELPGSARLEQIFGDRVILSREGRFEMLRLPRETLDSAAVVPAVQSSQAGGTEPAPPLRDAGLAASLATRRDTWLQEPGQFMESIRVRPVMEQGAMKGFAVSPRRDPALFRQAGLRPGDVVTGINGTPISAVTDPQALMAELAQATEVRLDLERQGRAMSLTLPIGQ
ncbi:type II secretion system protein GspC [Ectothiorhodospira lacustris]|uniref:type II secretion system protein GspC n=1 Tax=Ectothiorhodospira lacustris TaxID=2899127 RepID=UPI001EE9072B|nr:type II secretion system protein GspC [Ectothiorhodospira lacustris]MCG5500730.1 type II secretion system protein GspC [Ectothiorhodospira lacustris]MCG5509051.1 type II secretion system protein GspC [Ectothiorhodospira lacustris]MCG5520842.1 type II secretion system protein GspC [Ectothiorhodospira lacustris]